MYYVIMVIGYVEEYAEYVTHMMLVGSTARKLRTRVSDPVWGISIFN